MRNANIRKLEHLYKYETKEDKEYSQENEGTL